MPPYYSCIHRPVFPSQRSGYSSLSGALSPPPQFIYPRRYRVPQPMAKAKASGQPISQPVLFDYVGNFQQGVFIADFSNYCANGLVEIITGSNDLPLANTSVKEINLCIMWPGYEHLNLNWSFSTPASSSMTRIQLGASIAMHFWIFVEKATSSMTTCTRWKIGDEGIKFDKIVLVGLYSIGGDFWQADIAVDL